MNNVIHIRNVYDRINRRVVYWGEQELNRRSIMQLLNITATRPPLIISSRL